MSGTNWTNLTANVLARAADVNMDLDWFQGTFTPNFEGSKTDGAYDLGESSYMWRDGYFRDKVYLGTTTSFIFRDTDGSVKIYNSNTAGVVLKNTGYTSFPGLTWAYYSLNPTATSITGDNTTYTLTSIDGTADSSNNFNMAASGGVLVIDESGTYDISIRTGYGYPNGTVNTGGTLIFNTNLWVDDGGVPSNFNMGSDRTKPDNGGNSGLSLYTNNRRIFKLDSGDKIYVTVVVDGYSSKKADFHGGSFNIIRLT